jgi:demethylmenaquinone methyltransferase/2-methoxy-6-polyprenyl-1,4-benzoquinol methylase
MRRPDDRAAARALARLDLAAHLADPARKQAFVTPMFDLIAPRYDAFTRLFSFGMDAGWKRDALRRLAAIAPPRPAVVDVACGTGDLARAAATVLGASRVLGVDAAPAMIAAARAKPAPPGVRFAEGDLTRLALDDASVDVVTAGYALRNAPALGPALAELRRVLRPGGVLLTLDFYRPASRAWAAVFTGYLRVAGDLVGWLWHRSPVVYGYLGPSVRGWVTEQGFRDAARSHGFTPVDAVVRLGGGVATHLFRVGP